MRVMALQKFVHQQRSLKPGDVVEIDSRIAKFYVLRYPAKWALAPAADLGAASPLPLATAAASPAAPEPTPRRRGRAAAEPVADTAREVTEGLQTGETAGAAGGDTVAGSAAPVAEGSTEDHPAVDAEPAEVPPVQPATETAEEAAEPAAAETK